MTKDEINEYLFEHLFDNRIELLDYLTPEGMIRVIEAMREKHSVQCEMTSYIDGQQIAFFNNFINDNDDACANNLPEAVCRAAVEFLKEKEND